MAADRHAMPAFSVGDRREAVFALRLLDAGRQWLGKCAQRLSPLTEVLRGFFRRAGQPVVVGVWVPDHDHALFVFGPLQAAEDGMPIGVDGVRESVVKGKRA